MLKQENHYNKTVEEIKRIESLIGTGKISSNDLLFLQKQSNDGNNDARLVLGYYYLLEKNDENAALSLIGSKNLSNSTE